MHCADFRREREKERGNFSEYLQFTLNSVLDALAVATEGFVEFVVVSLCERLFGMHFAVYNLF